MAEASCMLVCEDNYSNAHGTPYVYKTLGIGKLVGTPVAGTMTAVWWGTSDRSESCIWHSAGRLYGYAG